MTAKHFEWLCFVGYVDAFHLLHVGGPSHPDFSWNFDNVKEQSFDFNLKTETYLNTGISWLHNILPELSLWTFTTASKYCETTFM